MSEAERLEIIKKEATKLKEQIIMLKSYAISSNTEWDSTPSYYRCDASQFIPVIENAKKALNEYNGDYMVFWWVGENPESVFLGLTNSAISDDQLIDTIDGEDYVEFTKNDCEIRWEGPHLKVFKCGAAQLFWQSKHTDDKMWCDLE